jgi:hypothetical protein
VAAAAAVDHARASLIRRAGAALGAALDPGRLSRRALRRALLLTLLLSARSFFARSLEATRALGDLGAREPSADRVCRVAQRRRVHEPQEAQVALLVQRPRDAAAMCEAVLLALDGDAHVDEEAHVAQKGGRVIVPLDVLIREHHRRTLRRLFREPRVVTSVLEAALETALAVIALLLCVVLVLGHVLALVAAPPSLPVSTANVVAVVERGQARDLERLVDAP